RRRKIIRPGEQLPFGHEDTVWQLRVGQFRACCKISRCREPSGTRPARLAGPTLILQQAPANLSLRNSVYQSNGETAPPAAPWAQHVGRICNPSYPVGRIANPSYEQEPAAG